MLDEIFKEYDIRGKVGEEITPQIVHRIARAFSDTVKPGVIAIGRDMRNDSAELAEAMTEGLIEQGREVWDLSLVTSDMVYFAIGKYELAGGAMITASHNPGKYNGIKFYREKAMPIGSGTGLTEIKKKVEASDFKEAQQSGGSVNKDIKGAWVQHLMSLCSVENLKEYRIAIDAGNGMTGHILPLLQERLPFKVREMYYDLDGSFPNHEANPMKAENLTDLIKTVKDERLDFGVAFDGDGDRVAFVDETGKPVTGSTVLSFIASRSLQQNPNSHIVFDVRASRATEETIKEAGGIPVRTKAGRTNISPKMREVNAPFGGETTGHLFFRDNYFTDSGLLGMMRFVEAMSQSDKTLSEQLERYVRYAKSPEINFQILNKQSAIDLLAEKYQEGRHETLDGLTVWMDDWWFNVRSSNTEPVLRLNVEAANNVLLAQKVTEIKKALHET